VTPTPVPLPIDALLPDLIAAVGKGPNAVLLAPPSAGKTTRVPPALLRAVLGDASTRVIVLEPRRIAARAAARRIAEEQGWTLGEEVGYQVRFERRAGPRTRILVVTEGILVQRLQADPFLEGVGAVVFDEFHERSLHVDLALAMARRVQREVRDDLRLVVMSATLDPAPVAAFLGGCPVLASPGRLHPVTVAHLAPAGRPGESDRTAPPSPTAALAASLAAAVVAGVRRALAESPGDVLVFLPGVGEIQRAQEALEPLAARSESGAFIVLPLYGDLPAEQQDAALRPHPTRRKVVLATNVAETSVTVDGVTAVVDTGLVRRLRFDPATGLDRLELGRVSRASADQRAGRAGRQAPGLCLRLWPAWEDASLPPAEVPEIRRVDLAAPALQLLAWGERDLAAFSWFEAPEPAALAAALGLLERLGAVDGTGVTLLGRTLARLPVHPRLGRLLVEGHGRGVEAEAALLAALLGERDPFRRTGPGDPPPHPSRSDLLDRLEDLTAFERRGGRGDNGLLVQGAARQVLRARDQLADLLHRELGTVHRSPAPAPGDREDALLRSVLAAWPDRLARRREPGSARAVMVGGRGVVLGAESAVRTPELFLCVDLAETGQAEARVRKASAVERDWLPAERLVTRTEVTFDPERERIVAWKRTRFDDLVLAEAEVPAPTGPEVEAVLAAAAAGRLERALPLDDPEVEGFLTRIRSLAHWRPELALPLFGPDDLRALLPTLAAGRRTFADLRRAPLREILEGLLTRDQRRALAEEAPERLEVPSGSHIRLTYEPGRPPVLAARIQELFGLAETPRVAGGRVPVLLHLLAPNGRPQQVTHDLKSFWATTYPQVRKELAGRYPKHAWPLDPWTAQPQRRPGRPRGAG
jgi:ATP-dependent helicase HrpB